MSGSEGETSTDVFGSSQGQPVLKAPCNKLMFLSPTEEERCHASLSPPAMVIVIHFDQSET